MLSFLLYIDYCEEFCYNINISFRFDEPVKHSLTEFNSVICVFADGTFFVSRQSIVHKADRPYGLPAFVI